MKDTNKLPQSTVEQNSLKQLSRPVSLKQDLEKNTRVRYLYSTKTNTFTPNVNLKSLNLKQTQIDLLNRVIPQVLSKSRIREIPCFVILLLFIVVTLLGFGMGAISILNGWMAWAGFWLIITPFFIFKFLKDDLVFL